MGALEIIVGILTGLVVSLTILFIYLFISFEKMRKATLPEVYEVPKKKTFVTASDGVYVVKERRKAIYQDDDKAFNAEIREKKLREREAYESQFKPIGR